VSSSPDAPRWFREAVDTPGASRSVEVAGVRVHYLAWGNPENPPLVLVHGGAAHAHWWSFLAPLLARAHHVVAVDLSGHGDSGWRPLYDYELWAAELEAVGKHAGFSRPPVVVGHSMGGSVTAIAASRSELAGAVIVDSPVRRPDPESEEGTRGHMFRRPKTYPDLETAVRHFHLVPPQPRENPWLLDHVARHSLRRVEGGWTWKFDPRAMTERRGPYDFTERLPRIRCRVAIVRGEYSQLVPPDLGEYLYELLHRNAPLIEIPQAHHHLLLDQPLAFVTCLRTLLADWEHSLPRRSPAPRTSP
jgi:pimeloyl-ACP methyl ester carboxylesterase